MKNLEPSPIRISIVLCKHKGLLPKLIRFFTKEKWDHVAVIKFSGATEALDFNYPHGFNIAPVSRMPWYSYTSVFPGIDISEQDYKLYKSIMGGKPYSMLSNLNFFTVKWFRRELFSGYNCVKALKQLVQVGRPTAYRAYYNKVLKAQTPESIAHLVSEMLNSDYK